MKAEEKTVAFLIFSIVYAVYIYLFEKKNKQT